MAINRCWLFVLSVAVCALPMPALGQSRATSADLTGIILDESRAVLSRAIVTVTNVETNLERVVASGPDGRFDVLRFRPEPIAFARSMLASRHTCSRVSR